LALEKASVLAAIPDTGRAKSSATQARVVRNKSKRWALYSWLAHKTSPAAEAAFHRGGSALTRPRVYARSLSLWQLQLGLQADQVHLGNSPGIVIVQVVQ
jgi:hypothetical protein